MTSTQPARGTRDFLPDDLRRRRYVIGVVEDVYRRYGFESLETPAIENIETLTGKYGDEGSKLIFKILRRGEHEASGAADLALRYDLTVPLARVVAQYRAQLPKYFKRYHIQPVWRADRPARGRFREFYKCDIDAIGSTSLVVEAELLAAVGGVLERLGFADFTIRLNDRRALTAMLSAAGIAEPQHGEALVALDKLDKIGVDGVAADLAARQVPADAARRCLDFLAAAAERAADPEAVLALVDNFAGADERGRAAAADLRTIVDLSSATGAASRLRIDPSLARGLSYYTGAIMEIVVPDLAGSLGGGGRYDSLIGMFLGQDVPACGFSLGLERIIVVMTERGMFPAEIASAGPDLMVTFLDDSCRHAALALAADVRTAGGTVEIFPEATRKLDRSLKYAVSRQAGLLAIIGSDELAAGQVTVKDLDTRSQERTAPARVVELVTARRRDRPHAPGDR